MDPSLLKALPKIYDAATSNDDWVSALDALAASVNARGALFFAINSTDFQYSVQKSNSIYQGKADALSEYMKRFSKYEDEGIRATLRAQPFTPIKDVDIWPDVNSLEYRDDIVFVRNLLGVFRRIIFNVSVNNLFQAGLILQYEDSYKEVPSQYVRDATFLAPHFSKSLELNRFFSQLYARQRAILSALDHVDIGICVATSEGHIAVANKKAEELLCEGDGFRINRSGRLTSDGEITNRALCNAIESVAKTALGEKSHSGKTLTIDRKSGKEGYLFEVSPLRDAQGEYEANFSGALVTIIDPLSPPRLRTKAIVDLYAVTPAELSVCDLLIAGKTASEISEIRSVSTETVRRQISSLYHKLGVNNRAYLIKKIVSMSPPIY